MTNRIWNGILESERLYRYYHSLAGKFRKRQWVFDIILLLLTGGVGITIAGHFLQGANETLALTLMVSVIAGIVTWQHIQGYKVKSAMAGSIAVQYKALSDDWRHQWYLGSNDNDGVIIGVLTARLTGIAAQYDMGVDSKRSEDAEDSADEVVAGEFASAP